MRVLLDATSLPPDRLGAAQYVLNLTAALARREDVELHVLAKRRDVDDVRAIATRATVHAASLRRRPSRLVWEQTVLPMRTRRLSPDVFHGPHYTLPPQTGCPSVVTFMDPTMFTHPQLHERSKVVYFTRMARVSVKRAARVLAISEYARRGAAEWTRSDPARIDVVHLGVDLERFNPAPQDRDDSLRKRVGVTGPYIVFFGAHEPRKDVPTLVRAFARLCERGADHTLVLAGSREWGATEIDEAIERSGVAGRIVRPGYVSEDEKVALFRGAAACAYPSIAEGFGLPVLEAMATGCPVVTTTGSAPEEVGGDTVSLIAPGDDEALRDAIEAIIADPAGAELRAAAARKRAEGFSWDDVAARTVEVYRRAMATVAA